MMKINIDVPMPQLYLWWQLICMSFGLNINTVSGNSCVYVIIMTDG